MIDGAPLHTHGNKRIEAMSRTRAWRRDDRLQSSGGIVKGMTHVPGGAEKMDRTGANVLQYMCQ